MKNVCGLFLRHTTNVTLDLSHFLSIYGAVGHRPAGLYVICPKITPFWLLNFLGQPDLRSVCSV